MQGFVVDWLNLLMRWLHVITAIAWIGESFYFVALDNSLRPAPQPPPAAVGATGTTATPDTRADTGTSSTTDTPGSAAATGVAGEFWQVHGGGFYHMQKFMLAPAHMPAALHWSKWPAYTTWLSGFALFSVLYLFAPGLYLIDHDVLPLSAPVAIAAALGFLLVGWFFYDSLCRWLGQRDTLLGLCIGLYVLAAIWLSCHLFSGRAAYLMSGAMLATIMSANVFFVIIPGQRKMVQALLAGTVPDPIYGKRGKQRSVHNTYFTLPVVFAMLSNHYALTYSNHANWLVLALIMLAGALIRQFFVLRHRGRQLWLLPLAGVALLAAALAVTLPSVAPPVASGTDAASPAVPAVLSTAAATPSSAAPARVELATIRQILTQRCVQCHSAHPSMMGSAPAGVLLDSDAGVTRNAARIYEQSVQLKAMPLGNVTRMTEAERTQIGIWFAQRQP